LIDEVFARQLKRAIALRGATVAERIAQLRKLARAVNKFQPALQTALWADLHKHESEATLSEISPVLSEIRHTIKNLETWSRPQRVPGAVSHLGMTGWVRPEPRGVCLIISPWNYPVCLLLGPLVSAIAAGNTAILKPSELTPHVAAVLNTLISETFAPEDVALFEGDASVSTQLLALPFNHIFFTGSPEIGKVVMAAAAKHLASVTLELGGKSPAIIDATADMAKTAARIAWGKFFNAGQTCVAPDYVFVHETVQEKLLTALKAAIVKLYGPAPQMSHDYGRIVSDRHFNRVKNLITGTVVTGGATDADEKYIAPTVLTNIPADAPIRTQEIFGPLLPVYPYRDLADVIAAVNKESKPLALYIFSENQEVIDEIVTETSSGGVCINNTVLQFSHPNLPFGGVNGSGFGAAHGLFGFRAFSHERAVLRDRFSFIHLVYPPYAGVTRWIVNKMK
jgi:aldehyde dehydrogenase (NAD+)